MRIILLPLLMFINTILNAQGISPLSNIRPIGKAESNINLDTIKIPDFQLFGIGNLNEESFNKINSGGKIAFSFNRKDSFNLLPSNFFISLNKNATNTDTLLQSTLVFPEVGSHSIMLLFNWQLGKKEPMLMNRVYQRNFIFVEFVTKKISVELPDEPEKEEFRFNTLHYTAGYKLLYQSTKISQEQTFSTGISITPFISVMNIPDEDNVQLESIIGGSVTKNLFLSAGVKVGLEINGFQIFADLRHSFVDDKKFPLKDLKGFNSNIGVAFNAQIFSL